MSEMPKPCPFCGGVPELNREERTNISPLFPYEDNSFWWVSCIKCKAKTNAYCSAAAALEVWNNRVENIVRCSDCCKYHSFGNGYGECSFFGRTMKDSEYCSNGLKK